MPRPVRVASPGREGITINMNTDQWRDVRDALTDYPHSWNRTDVAEIRVGLATIIHDVTNNEMDGVA